MKNTSRITALLIGVIMLLSAVACSDAPEQPGQETQSTTPIAVTSAEAVVTEDPYDEEGYLKSTLPPLDFAQAPVTVLYWKDVEMPEYEAKEQNGTLVNDAIFKRNSTVEDTLNVKLNFASTAGNGNNIQAFADYVGNVYMGGGKDFDLISSYSRTTALCALNGYVADMTDLPYLDFEKPWWPASLIDVVSIGNRFYFVSGDASINVLHFMYAVYYNKDMVSDFKLEDPVQLVDEDKWTLAKLQEMSAGAYSDLNSDGKKDVGDRYGFATVNYGLDAFYTGSGLRLVEQSDDELLVISEDFFSEKATDLCAALGDWFKTNDAYIASDYETTFVNGNCIFCQDRCYLADRKLQKVTFSYGILPTPKYDNDQKEFISVVGNPFSLYAIYGLSENLDRSAAVLECWAAEAYRTTSPAQFELNMKSKYSESSNESRMYDIIRSTVCFDMGRLYNPQLSNITDLFFAAAAAGSPWGAMAKSYSKTLPKQMQKIADAFAGFQSAG